MTNRFFPLSRFIIHGNSMLPTLKPGQEILCFKWAYIFSRPQTGDIVVIRHGGLETVKRILKFYNRECFIEGDNKNASTDSRNFGLVDQSEIVGKVVYVR